VTEKHSDEKGAGMIPRKLLVGALLVGPALILGYAAVAFAHSGAGEVQGSEVLGAFALSFGLWLAGYLFMVWEIPRLLFGDANEPEKKKRTIPNPTRSAEK
jgi:hypothetical protein